MADPVINVDTDQDLPQLLSRATPGTIFLLSSGDYGALRLRRLGGDASAPLMLRAADPANPPRFTSMTLNEVEHLALDGLLFDHTYTEGDEDRTLPFRIVNSAHISIRNSLFDGDIQRGGDPVTEGLPRGFGLNVRGAQHITISDNEIRTFFRGLVIGRSEDLIVTGNHLHNIRMDGMNFAQVQRLRVENNLIREFARALGSGDHADMIQFWTASTNAPSEDVIIRGNVLNSGFSPHTQSIFMRNELVDRGQAGDEMFYRNFVIEENVIINAHLHGISLGEADGVVIRRNTLIHNPYSAGDQPMRALWRPRIRVASASRNVTIQGNVAHDIQDIQDRADWVVANNVIAQDQLPDLPTAYSSLYLGAGLSDPRDLESYFPHPDGALNTGNVGAVLLQDSPEGRAARAALPEWERRTGFIILTRAGDSSGEVEFEILPAETLNMTQIQNARIEWDLGDGTQAQGSTLTHRYTAPDVYDVNVRIRLEDGQLLTRQNRIIVQTGEILHLDSNSALLSSYASSIPQHLRLENVTGPIPLGNESPLFAVPADMIRPISGADHLILDLRLRMEPGLESSGEVFRIHPALIVSVSARGVLELRFRPDDGQELRIQSAATPLINGDWVDLRLTHNTEDGTISMFADDNLVMRAPMAQPFPTVRSHGLSLGHFSDPAQSMHGAVEKINLRLAE